MKDYEYLFAMAVQQKLKKQIIGKIFVKVNCDDELITEIKNGDTELRSVITNFSDKIINGYPSDYAVYEIVNEYKKFILRKHFW